MKKQTVVMIWTSALLLLVVTCIGIYFVYNNQVTGDKPVEVFSTISTEIDGYSVFDKNGSYSLEKDEDGWHLEDDRKAELDQMAVEKMIAAASKITANKRLSRKELALFDSQDVATVKIDTNNGEDVTIRFLGRADNFCAFRISGDLRTYAMYESTRNILTPSIESLRITSVFPKLADTGTLPEYYRYTDYEGNVTEVRLKTGSELAKGKNNRYMMVKPYVREVDDDSFEQLIAVKIPLIKVKNFVKNPSKDKSDYGLDEKSRAELSFVWDDVTENLFLGRAEGGAVFAMKKDKEEVFLIDAALLEFLQLEPFFVLDSGILKNAKEKVTGVTVEKGDMVYNITSSKINNELRQYLLNGKAASSYVFDEILDALGDMSFKNEIDKEPKNTRDIQITVYYENGETQSISLVKTNEKAYAVFLNNKAEFEVYSDDVNELLEELKEASLNPMKMD
ncbi:MAG: DUF4340 domain-containing protein [Clostridia bacterium]|nr:DUF4340 domain-containing protein [Clostridia bacterium]